MRLFVQQRAPRRIVRALKRLDRRLDILWDPNRYFPGAGPPGRWRIVEWVPRWGRRSHVLWWEGPAREYKPLPGSADPILRQLREADSSRMRSLGERYQYFAEDVPGMREEALAKRRLEVRGAVKEQALDYLKRGLGEKIQTGPGQKSRSSYRWDHAGRERQTDTERWLKELAS